MEILLRIEFGSVSIYEFQKLCWLAHCVHFAATSAG
jgi:hypothetical protein